MTPTTSPHKSYFPDGKGGEVEWNDMTAEQQTAARAHVLNNARPVLEYIARKYAPLGVKLCK